MIEAYSYSFIFFRASILTISSLASFSRFSLYFLPSFSRIYSFSKTSSMFDRFCETGLKFLFASDKAGDPASFYVSIPRIFPTYMLILSFLNTTEFECLLIKFSLNCFLIKCRSFAISLTLLILALNSVIFSKGISTTFDLIKKCRDYDNLLLVSSKNSRSVSW